MRYLMLKYKYNLNIKIPFWVEDPRPQSGVPRGRGKDLMINVDPKYLIKTGSAKSVAVSV